MSVSDSLDIRVTHPVKRVGKELRVTTLKSHVDDREENRTLKRTVDGEKAQLQVKWIKRPNGIEIVHMHCLTDKKSSEWGKSSGVPLDKFYNLIQKDAVWEITCKKCHRRWNTSGSAAP